MCILLFFYNYQDSKSIRMCCIFHGVIFRTDFMPLIIVILKRSLSKYRMAKNELEEKLYWNSILPRKKKSIMCKTFSIAGSYRYPLRPQKLAVSWKPPFSQNQNITDYKSFFSSLCQSCFCDSNEVMVANNTGNGLCFLLV